MCALYAGSGAQRRSRSQRRTSSGHGTESLHPNSRWRTNRGRSPRPAPRLSRCWARSRRWDTPIRAPQRPAANPRPRRRPGGAPQAIVSSVRPPLVGDCLLSHDDPMATRPPGEQAWRATQTQMQAKVIIVRTTSTSVRASGRTVLSVASWRDRRRFVRMLGLLRRPLFLQSHGRLLHIALLGRLVGHVDPSLATSGWRSAAATSVPCQPRSAGRNHGQQAMPAGWPP